MTTITRENFDNQLLNQNDRIQEEITLSIISGRGKIMIICSLATTPSLRYSELKQLFDPISNRILTKQLRELEQDGIISRTVYPEVPPRVEYSITEHGMTLIPIINALHEWGEKHKSIYFKNI